RPLSSVLRVCGLAGNRAASKYSRPLRSTRSFDHRHPLLMSPTKLFTRREVLKTAVLGAAALPFLGQVSRSAEPMTGNRKSDGERVGSARENGLRLGVAS